MLLRSIDVISFYIFFSVHTFCPMSNSSCMISVNDIDTELQINLGKYASRQMTGNFLFHTLNVMFIVYALYW